MIPNPINVVAAELAGECQLKLTFDDGNRQLVDFRPFLLHSVHPDIRAYLDPQRFSGFSVQYGELVWGDYDLCFPVLDLYLNNIEKYQPISAAA